MLCCCSVAQLCPPLCDPMDCSIPGLLSLTISWRLPKFMSIALVMPSSHLILWCPLFLLPSVFPSIRDFSNEPAVCIRWPKYWSFSISPSNEYSRLISLKIYLFDLLAVQGTLRSLLQHHSSKASILWCSAFFTVQLSQPYVTTGKTIGLIVWTFVGRIMSLLFNTLSKFVIAFLPRNNCLLISWLQSPSTVILEPKKRKSVITSRFFPSICHEVLGQSAMILVFLICSFKLALSLSSFTLIKRFFSSLLSATRVVSSVYCFSGGSDGKASACNAGDPGLIPGSGRSLEKEVATHSSILAWRITWMEEPGRLQSTGVAKSRTWLSYFIFTFHLYIWGCWCLFHLSWFQLVTHPAWHFSWRPQPIG